VTDTYYEYIVGYSAESKIYRLWKPGTKIIVKARDVKIFEDIDCQDVLSKETFYVPYLNIDNNELKDNHESSIKNDEKWLIKATLNVAISMKIIQTRDRGKGRPALLKTGKPKDQKRFTSQMKTRNLRVRSWRIMMPSCD